MLERVQIAQYVILSKGNTENVLETVDGVIRNQEVYMHYPDKMMHLISAHHHFKEIRNADVPYKVFLVRQVC